METINLAVENHENYAMLLSPSAGTRLWYTHTRVENHMKEKYEDALKRVEHSECIGQENGVAVDVQ